MAKIPSENCRVLCWLKMWSSSYGKLHCLHAGIEVAVLHLWSTGTIRNECRSVSQDQAW